MIKTLKPKIEFIFKRTFILYILAAVFIYGVVDFKSTYARISLITLNRLRPDELNYLIEIRKDAGKVDRNKLEKYEFYYRNVTASVPDRADALGLLAFTSYHLGKIPEAVSLYKKALEINPTFFWYYHNLGAIYFKQGSYPEAVDILSKGIGSKPEPVLLFILSSIRLYLPVIVAQEEGDLKAFLEAQLKRGFRDSFILLILSQHREKHFAEMLAASYLAAQTYQDDAPIFLYFAGLAAYELKDYAKAVYLFNQCIELDADHADAHRYLALTMKELGSEEAALKVLQKAVFLEQNQGTRAPTGEAVQLEIF